MNVYPLYDGGVLRFDAVLEACFKESLDTEQRAAASKLAKTLLETDTPIKQLENYLSELGIGAQCAVVEGEYLDKNFSDDYTAYYGGCFRECPRKCCRIHFFKEAYEQKTIERLLVTSHKDPALDEFKQSYLGFVVIRPLRHTIVGRTCLVPYKSAPKAQDKGRHYPAVCKNEVSFFGIKLSVECMPFQEQDCGTSACATCALWSAFSVSAKMFGNKCLSPSAITTIATENNFSVGTRFPNRGLTTEEMVYVVRENGLEPIFARLKNCDISELEYLFPGFVYAYLNLGVSVIAVIEDIAGGGKHAIAINGYNLKADNGEGLSAKRIDKFYANDDQCCPGARYCLRWDKKALIIDAYHNSSHNPKLHKSYTLEYLMVPIYHKIRVTFNEVAQLMFEANGILLYTDLFCSPLHNEFLKKLYKKDEIRAITSNIVAQVEAWERNHSTNLDWGNGDEITKGFLKNLLKKYDKYCSQHKGEQFKKIQWDVTIRASNDVKEEIRSDVRIPERSRVEILEQALPHYVWCIRISYGKKDSAIILIDATDSVRGVFVVGVFFYDTELQVIARNAYANTKEIVANPVLKALCAY